jgi:hypothetical protein
MRTPLYFLNLHQMRRYHLRPVLNTVAVVKGA